MAYFQIIGSLALISLLAYGTFASLAPNLKSEISRNLSKEDKEGLQNLLTNCMIGISDSFMKWVSLGWFFLESSFALH